MSASLPARWLELSARTAAALRESGLRIVVTGAGGWLGQATLEMLERALDADFESRVVAFGSRARTVHLRSGRGVALAPLEEIGRLPASPTLLLHYAFLTKDRVAGLPPGQYFEASEAISARIGAGIAALGVTRMLFPSSGAVYGLPMRPDRSVRAEPDANPYGTQKLRDEERFGALCADAGARLAVPRVFSLSGPYINKHELYALASIVGAALAGARVELRARRRVVRAYVGVRDLLDVSIGWLLGDAQSGQVVFDSGGEPIEIGDLARRVVTALGRPGLEIERPPLGAEPDDEYFGDAALFDRMAASQGIRPAELDDQIRDTAAFLAGEVPRELP
jgi:UDP-glucuronate decarboxylase